jgi:hypothetical protein
MVGTESQLNKTGIPAVRAVAVAVAIRHQQLAEVAQRQDKVMLVETVYNPARVAAAAVVLAVLGQRQFLVLAALAALVLIGTA